MRENHYHTRNYYLKNSINNITKIISTFKHFVEKFIQFGQKSWLQLLKLKAIAISCHIIMETICCHIHLIQNWTQPIQIPNVHIFWTWIPSLIPIHSDEVRFFLIITTYTKCSQPVFVNFESWIILSSAMIL